MGTSSSLVDHAREILVHPQHQWQVVDGEPTTVGDLYRQYIVPLAAIGPAAAFVGMVVFGIHIPFVGRYRASFGSALASAIVQYVLALAGVYVLALIIEALAPTFDGQRNRLQALKVAAYAMTAAWVAGIFALIPALSVLGILGGLYSLYLLYLGLPVLMKSPPQKALGYTALVVICAIVIFFVVSAVSGAFLRLPNA